MTVDLETRQNTPATGEPRPRTVSIRLSSVLTGCAVAVLAVATATFGMLYLSARTTIADHDRRAAEDRRVEQVALDYALGASTIDYRDAKAWLARLKTGTTPQLSGKFDATAPQLEQILLPLQWTSTATPLSAGVVSESGGVYKVNAYLTVNSTSVQNPTGTLTTVAYSLTVDRNADWRIADVGGLQNALPLK
ncbi:hypothetical protein [Nocardia sp. GTS18]|uniref:hypothetical protein n=1 Tax=Nocardia sp. GTS18 TaxID=1778064 RepID=UPI0021034DF4|nr:hypothetical protein [Nocardia sp. GTS18]